MCSVEFSDNFLTSGDDRGSQLVEKVSLKIGKLWLNIYGSRQTCQSKPLDEADSFKFLIHHESQI